MKKINALALFVIFSASCSTGQPDVDDKDKSTGGLPVSEFSSISEAIEMANKKDRRAVDYLINYYSKIGDENKKRKFSSIGKKMWILSAFKDEIREMRDISDNVSEDLKLRKVNMLSIRCIQLKSIRSDYIYDLSKNGNSEWKYEEIDILEGSFNFDMAGYEKYLSKDSCSIS